MKISTKGEYGIRAMLYLAMHPGEILTSQEIARHQAVPEAYLRQILAQLSRAGLVASSRGPSGGQHLAKPADEISVRDILLCLEGHTTSIDDILALPCDIEVGSQFCVLREVFLDVKRAVDRILGNRTLASLAERQREILASGVPVPADLPRRSALPIVSD